MEILKNDIAAKLDLLQRRNDIVDILQFELHWGSSFLPPRARLEFDNFRIYFEFAG